MDPLPLEIDISDLQSRQLADPHLHFIVGDRLDFTHTHFGLTWMRHTRSIRSMVPAFDSVFLAASHGSQTIPSYRFDIYYSLNRGLWI